MYHFVINKFFLICCVFIIKYYIMASKKSLEKQDSVGEKTQVPKSRQLIRMLSFRIVPEYYKKIENVADDKNTTVSALIRRYIKEGMVRDLEIKGDDTSFRIE